MVDRGYSISQESLLLSFSIKIENKDPLISLKTVQTGTRGVVD